MPEEDLPILRDGEAPPGRFPERADGSLGPWEGQLRWVTLHGPARVFWTCGRRSSATNVLLPDGGRAASVTRTMGSFQGPVEEWRLAPDSPGGEHVLGTLSLTDGDAVLVPLPRRREEGRYARDDAPDLRDDLAADPHFVARCGDERFAVAVYKAFENQAYRKGSGWARFLVSFRTAGAFVARVRDLGEDYLSFYCARFEDIGVGDREGAALSAEFDGFVGRAGWHRVGAEEDARDAETAKGLLLEWSARDEGPSPGWARARMIAGSGEAPAGGHDVFSLARRLALMGQVTEEEYDMVLALV